MDEMNINSERIIFRPAPAQIKRLHKLEESGKYKTRSELIRRLLNVGLDILESE
jgi:Arc/MetJ-type ribon-helix-helix transcriptional regulator